MQSKVSIFNRAQPNLRAYSVKEVLPQYYSEAYPHLVTFLEGYYDYLDSDEAISGISDLTSIYDLESTTLEHIDYIFKTIADGANSTYFSDPREVLRNFANFYRVKGTKFSAEGFFRAFYGIDVEVEYPKNNIFIVGESQIGTESLRFIQNSALYQIFSVLIKSSIPLNTWKDLYKKFVHPAGFFLGGSVVLEIPSTNSTLLTMPDNIEEPPPPVLVEGAASLGAVNQLTEIIGILPDNQDSDSVVERINLNTRINRFKDVPLQTLIDQYERIDDILDINSPLFSEDSGFREGTVTFDNKELTMDYSIFKYDSNANRNPRYITIGYVEDSYVELT